MNMTKREWLRAMHELCDGGLLTCTRGKVGDDDATYALAAFPLNDPDRFPADIQELHLRNMAKFGGCNTEGAMGRAIQVLRLPNTAKPKGYQEGPQ